MVGGAWEFVLCIVPVGVYLGFTWGLELGSIIHPYLFACLEVLVPLHPVCLSTACLAALVGAAMCARCGSHDAGMVAGLVRSPKHSSSDVGSLGSCCSCMQGGGTAGNPLPWPLLHSMASHPPYHHHNHTTPTLLPHLVVASRTLPQHAWTTGSTTEATAQVCQPPTLQATLHHNQEVA